MLVQVPSRIVLPLNATRSRFPMVQFQQKEDFGITAATVATIAIAATGTTAVGIALSQMIQNAATVNQLSERVTEALQMQETLMDRYILEFYHSINRWR